MCVNTDVITMYFIFDPGAVWYQRPVSRYQWRNQSTHICSSIPTAGCRDQPAAVESDIRPFVNYLPLSDCYCKSAWVTALCLINAVEFNNFLC